MVLFTACGQQSKRTMTSDEPLDTTTRTSRPSETAFLLASDSIGQNELRLTDGEMVFQIHEPFEEERIPENAYQNTLWSYSEELGDITYTLKMWEQDNTTIEVCNFDYDKIGKDINDYYLCRVLTRNPHYKTTRNICVGNTLQDVMNAYGEGIMWGTPQEFEDGSYCIISYYLNGIDSENRLAFWLDSNSVVRQIDVQYFTIPLAETAKIFPPKAYGINEQR